MSIDINLIKDRILISDIITRRVKLTNKGNNSYIGLCPFHTEKTPSFFVNDQKQIYHCFGCGSHGDIFTFIMKYESISYRDSLKNLASIAGITFETNNRKENNLLRKKQSLLEINQKIAVFYQKQLFSSIGRQALQYIYSRGIKLEVIKKYNIGFSPNQSFHLINELKKDFSEDELYEFGILRQKNNQFFDPFYNRLIFPIQNQYGEFIGFGGRLLENGEPKYLNSSESIVFKKSDNLYGYNLSKMSIIKAKDAIVVEGYMDVMTLANFGITNVIAPLGTTINLNQIKSLWNICQEPTICFDNDKSGVNGANKIAYEVLESISYNKSLKFMNLVGGKDPDEILKNKGIKFFKKLFTESHPLADYLFNIERNKLNLGTPEKKVALKIKLRELVKTISDIELQRSYFNHFKKKYANTIFNLQKYRHYNNIQVDTRRLLHSKKKDNIEILIISILWWVPKLLDDNEVVEELMKITMSNELDKIRKILLDFSLGNEDNLLLFFDNYIKNSKERKIINNIIDKKLTKMDALPFGNDIKRSLFKIFYINKIDIIKKEINIIKKKLLKVADLKLMQEMLLLKEYEKQLKDEIIKE